MKPVRVDFRDQIASNKRKSSFLILIVILVIVALGYVISLAFEPGYFFFIMAIAIMFSIIYTVVGYYNSDKIAIASVKGKLAPHNTPEGKRFYDLVEGLTLASGLPMPKLYIMDSLQINAFASGRDPKNAVICVTKGALEKLDKRELEGVLAHELGHIGNYDIRYMTLVAVLVGMVAIISQLFLRSLWFRGGGSKGKGGAIFILIGVALAIIAPIVVYLVQMSISRKREFTSDATAVRFTRYPQGLINALKKIRNSNQPEKKVNKAVAPLFFANPFTKTGLNVLSSTHPPIDKRIAVLERM